MAGTHKRQKGRERRETGGLEVQDWSEESSPEPSCVLLPTHKASLPFPPLLPTCGSDRPDDPGPLDYLPDEALVTARTFDACSAPLIS
jgi:hypothetical protein